jgi:hypothetical protein
MLRRHPLLSKFRTRLTFANVVSVVALFVALGGSSYAALKVTSRNVPKDALTGADIKNLTGKDVRNDSLTGADVKNLGSGDVANGKLLAEDFAPGQVPKGETGETGPPGAPGAAASATSRDSKPALIATASDTFQAFDGPSVTVQVPEGGALVVVGASVDVRNTTQNGEAWAFLFEGANTLARISERCGDCSSTFETKGGGITTWAPAGTHTYELRYRRYPSGTAEFRNRSLAASVLK